MSNTKLDFAFDRRVSEEYDYLRSHPPAVSQQIGASILSLAGKNARILELGVGTGRIALPVVAAGGSVVGIDLSAEMLGRLQQRVVGTGGKLFLVRADISQLPLSGGHFDSVVAVHVLHLVGAWRAALAGAMAVLRPNGRFMLGRDWIDPNSIAGEIQNEFRRVVVQIMGPQLKAPTSGSEIAKAINELGAVTEYLGVSDFVAAEWTTEDSPQDAIHAIRTRAHAESWILTDEFITPVVERLELFAQARWSNLKQSFTTRRRFLLSVFRLPAL
jgi:ubiquinone/menaquinone biosynthesis C-methylase UbiE